MGSPSLMEFLANWQLFRDPILCGMGAGAALGVLGVFIVLKRMVFISAALSQAAGLGVALSFLAQIHWGLVGWLVDPKLGALLLTLFAALLLYREPKAPLTREGMLGMAYLVGMGGTLLVGTRITQEAHDIQAILFGTGVMVRPQDTVWILGVGLVVLVWTFWWRRGLLFAAFNPDGARVRQLPVAAINLLLMVLIALMVSIATRALGALPVFAFSVLPAMAAIALAATPVGAMLLALVLGAFAGFGGYVLAFFGEFPVGASQTVTAAGLTVAALLLRWASRARLSGSWGKAR